MSKYGLTAAGAQRFRCAPCDTTAVRRRSDNSERRHFRMFLTWIAGKTTTDDIARRAGVSRQTVWRWFAPFWSGCRPPDGCVTSPILVLDGTAVVAREVVSLIAGDPQTSRPVGWRFSRRECFAAWLPFLTTLKDRGAKPEFVVCDGQKGLQIAIRTVWPEAKTQRCVVHVHRQAMAWLTRNPKTAAGQALRRLVSGIFDVRTVRQRRRWQRRFRRWDRRHRSFLKERTVGPNGWWYTHRRVRAVRSLIRNSLPNLFRFVKRPDVPRTSNHVEGGINSRIKELLRSHRGLKRHQRLALVSWYLHLRATKIPTRNVT
ncbi:hypothetical protein A3C96_03305 [Candidatus Uhrbacteria bacterium RIFCSPHIGHO2_02_FULL_60_10]|uniref:Mutator family transposase n=1 Tax=Candidatus Uhrbacteria bacterium RIFCSPHIGHO2_02_FULL_60_10 TaxID=1802392 RepID=A0A1F7U876_9BACT|nr:MAG: hypothetical protein A3C96_03305 [Candidatus Uhrbacteria bacterium RIFCSPHIGHO2_02_FULL_60_10]